MRTRLLNRPHLLEHYRAATASLPIEAMVFVQCEADFAAFEAEAAWVAQLAQQEPRIKGLVAWAPLEEGGGPSPTISHGSNDTPSCVAFAGSFSSNRILEFLPAAGIYRGRPHASRTSACRSTTASIAGTWRTSRPSRKKLPRVRLDPGSHRRSPSSRQWRDAALGGSGCASSPRFPARRPARSPA